MGKDKKTRGAELRKGDLLIIPLCQAGLLVVAGLAAWATHLPMLFPSLGPTVYELVERPHQESASPYNLIVGHLIGVLAGFAALALTHCGHAPAVNGLSPVTLPRLLAGGLAALLTVFGTMVLRATQPAAIATSLVVALGSMQQWRDGPIIMASILLMTALGEPLRRWRYREGANAS